jgi:hypothetical protein
MGHHNFNDEVLVKRWQVGQKMNGMGEKFKDENIQSNSWKSFSFVVKSYVCFQSFVVHISMSVENTIEKL